MSFKDEDSTQELYPLCFTLFFNFGGGGSAGTVGAINKTTINPLSHFFWGKSASNSEITTQETPGGRANVYGIKN